MELYIGLCILAILMIFCLLSSKISSIVNMPSLLLFLAVGMLAGSEGIGGIEFSNATIGSKRILAIEKQFYIGLYDFTMLHFSFLFTFRHIYSVCNKGVQAKVN